VTPEIPTEKPKLVAGAGVGALQLGYLLPAAWRLGEHVHPAGTAAWPVAPTTAVVPEMATEMPKPSSPMVSVPLSSAACSTAGRLGEHVRPAGALGVEESAHDGVVPEIATDHPK